MPKIITKTDGFSRRISEALSKINDTYEVIAKNLGVSRNTIMTYKKCQGDIKGVVIKNLAQHYDFNPTWLLTGEGSIYKDEKEEAPDQILQSEKQTQSATKNPQKTPDNLTSITKKHRDIIEKFIDKETGMEFNSILLELERLSAKEYYALLGYAKRTLTDLGGSTTRDEIQDNGKGKASNQN